MGPRAFAPLLLVSLLGAAAGTEFEARGDTLGQAPVAPGRVRDAARRLGELAVGLGPSKPRALVLRAVPPPIRNRIIRAGLTFDEDSLLGLRISLASSGEELIAAARLVHDMYVKRGISAPDSSGLRVTSYTAHPRTATFLARRDGRIVGTISLVMDSPLGVPMEKIYPEEVGRLRAAGRAVAEVGALAIAQSERGQGLVHLLTKAMFDHARVSGVDDLVISVHPDVEDLYRATLLFQRMGRVKIYPGLERSALAAPLRLNLHTAAARMHKAYAGKQKFNLYRFYCTEKRPEITLPPGPPSAAEYRQRTRAGAHLLASRGATLTEASPLQRRMLDEAGLLASRATGVRPARFRWASPRAAKAVVLAHR